MRKSYRLMLLLALFLSLFILTSGYAHTCKVSSSENFQIFFDRFLVEKEFAISRTVYPVRHLKQEYGLNENGQEDSSATLTLLTEKQYKEALPLSTFIQENKLIFEIKMRSKNVATVKVYKSDTDWVLEYHFIQKHRCWFLREIEDLSL